MSKEKIKNYIIIGLSILIIILIILILFFAFHKKEMATISGTVIGVGNGYIILESDESDYILNTETEYEIGDKLEVKTSDIDSTSTPNTIKNGTVSILEKTKKNAILKGTVEITEDKESINNESNNIDSKEQNSPNQNITIDSENILENNKEEEEKNTTNEMTLEPETNKDATVLAYLSEIDNISPKSNESGLKKGFITIVDFLFYDGKIKGVSFHEITSKTKLTVLKYALKVDKKIDQYFPNYKEKISNTGNKVYTGIKNKIVKLYLETTSKICNSNPDLCKDAKRDFQDMKASFGITWDIIKTLAQNGVSNLKDWYEIFSGK